MCIGDILDKDTNEGGLYYKGFVQVRLAWGVRCKRGGTGFTRVGGMKGSLYHGLVVVV